MRSISISRLFLKLKNRSELELRINDNPNSLSSKRPRIVTRPDVEKALFLWVKHMEEKRETVAQRADFEKAFNVPEDERLK